MKYMRQTKQMKQIYKVEITNNKVKLTNQPYTNTKHETKINEIGKINRIAKVYKIDKIYRINEIRKIKEYIQYIR